MMLSRRIAALHRELATAAWRYQEIEHDQRLASEADVAELRAQVLNLGRKINELEALLELAEQPGLETGHAIGPGTVVEVVDAASGEAAEYRLVDCQDDSDSTVISVGSPIGQALLGRQPGSLVTLNLPDGVRRVEVVSTHPIGASGAGEETA
jgi:transcription elongation GreA/GreB family factor